ncbi:hypothetical protein ANN_17278 [Periplaneta americana]|uniref:Uncharacterized protein n=1 Tax=Periplaneta americana TaxID=6978 RepID=A0ABQ8SSH4_PERAM|nr:hypothetical protein ANN_17278 [Periplaneta americana]
MFLHSLGINDMWVMTAMQELDKGTGIVSPDKRGKHRNRGNAVSESVKDSIRQHICSFPAVDSHYIRKDSTRKFLDGDLSIAKMYRLYKERINENGRVCATERQYREVFVKEFNIAFFFTKEKPM